MNIGIKPLGNLGNRMIQYLGARHLQSVFPDSRIIRSNLPELNVTDDNPSEGLLSPYLQIKHPDFSFAALLEKITYEDTKTVVIDDYMQRLTWLPDAQMSAEIFPPFEVNVAKVLDTEILINICAGDLTEGVPHYPLPVDFYDGIIGNTGLSPVFMGQIGENAYCDALRARYPKARFITSLGALADFETIRQAAHIVISISTFSWLAAWLSRAKQIFVPILGWLHPMMFPNRLIDLLPSDDPRYRFMLFPKHFGLPEHEALTHHFELSSLYREISPPHVQLLREHAPVIKVDLSKVTIPVDEFWYCHQYKRAALEISEGWYENATAHYMDVGKRRGLIPASEVNETAPVRTGLIDHALGKRASQSSTSDWSYALTPDQDAARAVQGLIRYPYAFHTDAEESPWWRVDLGEPRAISRIVASNRADNDIMADRARPISAAVSSDGETWIDLDPGSSNWTFTEADDQFVWECSETANARFVRLAVRKWTILHLKYVGVFGPD